MDIKKVIVLVLLSMFAAFVWQQQHKSLIKAKEKANLKNINVFEKNNIVENTITQISKDNEQIEKVSNPKKIEKNIKESKPENEEKSEKFVSEIENYEGDEELENIDSPIHQENKNA